MFTESPFIEYTENKEGKCYIYSSGPWEFIVSGYTHMKQIYEKCGVSGSTFDVIVQALYC